MKLPAVALAALAALLPGIALHAEAADPTDAIATAPAPVQEVTILGRLRLESKISSFVYGITSLENYEGTARWQQPLCPSVTGLPRDQGEYILQRLSDVALTAGVPVAGEKCRPNLFVFVTTQPKQLLRAMEDRFFAASFGNATPSQVDQFINQPRPVKVWNSPYWTPQGGAPLSVGLPADAQLLGGSLSSPPTYNSPGGIGASRLSAPGTWTFGNVFVIVDQTQLQGVSGRQFADYIAMVSLADIKPAAHVGDTTQSILKLFAEGRQGAPAAMSEWDLAFLKSVYATASDSTQQRSLISRHMMDQLVH